MFQKNIIFLFLEVIVKIKLKDGLIVLKDLKLKVLVW